MKKTFIFFMLFAVMITLLLLCSGCAREKAERVTKETVSQTDEIADLFTETEGEKKPAVLEDTLDPTTLSGAKKAAYDWCDKAFQDALEGKSAPASSFSWSDTYSVFTNQMDRYYNYYLDGGMTFDQFTALMNSFAGVQGGKGIALGYLDAAKLRTSFKPIEEARQWVEKGNYLNAVHCLAKADKSEKTLVKDIIAKNKAAFSESVSDAVTTYMVRYQIDEAIAFLKALHGCGLDSHIKSELDRLEEYRAFQEDDLVPCNVLETLENIYTHCLIAYPEINFASSSTYRWCGDDCLTVSEFFAILEALYEKGYIIVDANLFYDGEKDTTVNTLMLPEGKKPLLLTYDDVTYDSRKTNRGMVDKLILDENGRVCTYTKHANGKEEISYTNEIFPIIESFCREHPDFTFRGAKGTLFFTGFDGICGYRSQANPVNDAEAALKLDRQSEIRAAKVVIEALREEGFTFGSHSYSHYRMPKYTPAQLHNDTNRWLEEVGGIIGETQLFCWPYGGHTAGGVSLRSNAEHKFLFDSGFKFFFGCGTTRYFTNEPDGNGIFSDRKAITGEILYFYKMGYKTYVREYSYLFDPDSIWDTARVPYMYMAPYDASKAQ